MTATIGELHERAHALEGKLKSGEIVDLGMPWMKTEMTELIFGLKGLKPSNFDEEVQYACSLAVLNEISKNMIAAFVVVVLATANDPLAEDRQVPDVKPD